MIISFSEIIRVKVYYLCVKVGTQKLVYISLNRIKTGPRSCAACNYISDRQREGLLRIKFVIYGTPF